VSLIEGGGRGDLRDFDHIFVGINDRFAWILAGLAGYL